MTVKLLLLYGTRGAYALLTLALGAIVARTWGVQSFALYSLMWTVFAVGLIVGSLGTNFYLIELLPKLQRAQYAATLRRLTFYVLLGSAISAVLAACLLNRMNSYWFAACALIPAALHVMSSGGLIAEGRQIASGCLDGVLRPLVTLTITWCAGHQGASPASGIGLGLIVGYIVSAGIGFWLLRNSIRVDNPAAPIPKVPLLKPLTVFVSMGALITLLAQADRFIIASNGTSQQLASYAASQNLANIVVYAVNSAAVIALPAIAAVMAGAHSAASLWRALDRLCRPLVGLSALAALAAAGFGDNALRVFGPGFASGRWPLVVLLAGTAISLTFGFPMSILSMSRLRISLIWHLAAGTMALLILSFAMLPIWGIVGVAAANAICAVGVRISLYCLCVAKGLPAYHVVPALRRSPSFTEDLADRR